MISTLDGIRQFQEISESDRTIDDLVLDEVQESFLASYLSESKTRSTLLKLVQDDDVLLEGYLKLNAKERAQIEKWRVKSPAYLEGDYEAEAGIRRRPKKQLSRSWEFYKEVHSRKAIAKIVELYIQRQPTTKDGRTSKQRPVPITTWFESYDPKKAKNLIVSKKGKRKTIARPPADKYYQQYGKLKRGNKTKGSFEEWILSQLTPRTKQKLLETPYYAQTELTIEQTVKLYIQHQPTTIKQGPVALTTWFTNYDPQTVQNLKTIKKRKTTSIGTPPANKYYAQHKGLKKKGKTTLSFEEWIHTQIPPKLKKQLLQTPHYIQTELTIEQIVQLYIQHQPTAKKGPVPLQAWFQSYNPRTAQNLRPSKKGKKITIANPPSNKYYVKYARLKKKDKKTSRFEQWILKQVSNDTRKAYRGLRRG